MFHYKNNLFFGRREDGNVRVLKIHPDHKFPGFPTVNGPPPVADQWVELDAIIDADGWASIVASVSKQGETGATFRQARDFHG